MNLDESEVPGDDQNGLSASLPIQSNLSVAQHGQQEGIGSRFRQKVSAAAKRVQTTRHRKSSAPDLANLSTTNQEILLRAVKTVRNEDSKQIVALLNESRIMFQTSLEDFRQEQEEYRRQLEYITKQKEAAIGRRKENAIPLSVFLRQKRDVEGLADLRPNSGMNTTYQAYFEALLAPDQNQEQHPTDKAAVVKYIRRRERRRRADENRESRQLTEEIVEKQKSEILKKVDGIDVKLEHERQRQADLLRTKLHEQKLKSQNMVAATGIIDQAHEANLVRQRIEQKQRDKFEAHLTEVRNRTPTNPIHVQSRDNDNTPWTDEQRSATQNSIQLLNDNTDQNFQRTATSIYGDDNVEEKMSTIHI